MIPGNWYNVVPDLPAPPPPPLYSGTRQPIGPDDLAPLFPMELIAQEVSGERFVQLRYHGMSPLLSHMYDLGLFEAVSRSQK
ncbi:hypothetical protein [Nonomuraea sp. NPDC049480]|uniref:hypothetical protein n=1 Tax=Nonomuraea sp. NPDC049480 TaxID=3364353 RepID=UPI0037AEBFFC